MERLSESWSKNESIGSGLNHVLGCLVRGLFMMLSICSVVGASDLEGRPNVLFIAVDDLRPELACYGKEHIQSPHIDSLAAEGTVFARAYCQVAVCGASRASLMTGLRPTPKRFLNYLTYAEKDAPGAMTLPEEFKRKGYHCISNGKIFHHRTDTEDRSWSEPAWKPRIGGATPLDPESKKLRGGTKNRGPVFEAAEVPDHAYPDGQTAEKTVSDLKRMKAEGKSFFIASGFLKPHLPFYAPKRYWDLYDPEEIGVADNQFKPVNAPEALKGSGEIHSYHDRGLEYNSDEWHRRNRHGYYACVSYIDAQIGKILDALEELKLRENTIIVFWGDHGFHLGEHNYWSKHNVLHWSTHSPLIVSAPGLRKGQKVDRLVEFVDIYPSLCDLAGITTVNQGLQGVSFKPLMMDPSQAWKRAAFSKYGSAVSVITERYNYAEFKNGERMLFDLREDAGENENVVALPEHRERVEALSRVLADGWEKVLP